MAEVRVQDEQGNIHVFPDGSTPEMIAQAMNVKPPEPTGTISNAPTGVKPWLQDLESDIRTGGTRTLPGRVLHAMGAPGTNAGVAPEVADTVASPVLGPVHAAQGVADIPQNPWQGTKKALGGVLETATLPASFIAPEASEAAGSLMAKSKALIPSTEHAGQGFKDVMGAAKDVPVQLQNSRDAILRMMDWQKKTQLGPTVNKFLNRVTNPKLGDITYGEARDFYQLLGRLSADEMSKLPPSVRFDLTRMVTGLKTDVGNAAQVVGKGKQYYDAMKEFASAKRLEDLSDKTKEIIVNALKYGIGPGLAGYFAKQGIDAATQKSATQK